jgi:hypothetical protein
LPWLFEDVDLFGKDKTIVPSLPQELRSVDFNSMPRTALFKGVDDGKLTTPQVNISVVAIYHVTIQKILLS